MFLNFNFIRFFKLRVAILNSLLCILLCVSCATSKDKELAYVKEMCSSETMVGSLEGTKAEIKAKLNEMQSLKLSGGLKKYRYLSQELEDYNTQWERLNQDMQDACISWAICQYRTSDSNACKEELEEKKNLQKNARYFFLKIKSFDRKLKDTEHSPPPSNPNQPSDNDENKKSTIIITGDQSPVINSKGNVNINYGVSAEVINELGKTLKLQDEDIRRLLLTIDEKEIALKERGVKLQELAKKYRELLDAGDLESAEKLLEIPEEITFSFKAYKTLPWDRKVLIITDFGEQIFFGTFS